MENYENLDEEIDDILNPDGETEDITDAEKLAGKSQKPAGKDPKSVLEKRYKDLEEHARQQSEDIKSLKAEAQKQQAFFERLKGIDPNDDLKKVEIETRKIYEEDAPGFTLKKIKESEERISQKIENTERRMKLKEIYESIENDYEVDFNKLPKEVLDTVDLFDEKVRQNDPKKVLLTALQANGLLKKRDSVPYTESSIGGNGNRMPKNMADKAADQIINRLEKGLGKKSNNVFGIG